MCNFYSLTKGQVTIRQLTEAMRDTTGNLPPFPGVFPDYLALIVRTAEDGVRELTTARWGMPTPAFVPAIDALRDGGEWWIAACPLLACIPEITDIRSDGRA